MSFKVSQQQIDLAVRILVFGKERVQVDALFFVLGFRDGSRHWTQTFIENIF